MDDAVNSPPEEMDPEMGRLLDELCHEIKDLLQYYSSSEVVQILEQRRAYRRSFSNSEEQ